MHILRYVYVAGLAVAGLYSVGIPATAGPSASIAWAKTKCGGLNQRACKIYERPGRPCNKGLVERSSNPLDPNAGVCRKRSSSGRGILTNARRMAASSTNFASSVIRIWASCSIPGNILRQPVNRWFHDAVVKTRCYSETMELARDKGYRTVTIGFTSGGGIGIGGEFERGYAFDVLGQLNSSQYRTKAFEIGTLGGGGGLAVGFFKGTNQAGRNGIGGTAHGGSGSINKGVGTDLGVWYGYDGYSLGLTVAITKGLGGDFAYVRNETEVWSTRIRPTVVSTARAKMIERSVYKPVRTQPNSLAQYEYKGQKTEVQFCNRARRAIDVAFVYYDWGYYSRRANWSSVGWWRLETGSCSWIGMPDQQNGSAYSGEIFVVGLSDGKRWQARSGLDLCSPAGDAFHFANTEAVFCDDNDVLIGKRHLVGPNIRRPFTFQD